MPRYCAECGAQLPASARFCVSCGAQVVRPPADEPTRPVATSRAGDVDEPTAPMTLPDQELPAPSGGAPTPPGRGVGSPPAARPPGPRTGSSSRMAEQFSAWPDGPTEASPWDPPAPPPTPAYAAPTIPLSGTQPGGPSGPSAGAEPDAGAPRPAVSRLILGALALLVVGGLFWAVSALRGPGNSPVTPGASRTDSASGPVPTASGSSGAGSGTTTETTSPAQAARLAVGSVLDAGRGSRSTLVQGFDAYCTNSDTTGGRAQMDDALQGRMAQLAKLNSVGDGPFQGLSGGLDARDKLRAALQASAAADQIYVQMAAAGTVCQGGLELTQANAQASSAKKNFLDTWNPMMRRAHLQELASDDL